MNQADDERGAEGELRNGRDIEKLDVGVLGEYVRGVQHTPCGACRSFFSINSSSRNCFSSSRNCFSFSRAAVRSSRHSSRALPSPSTLLSSNCSTTFSAFASLPSNTSILPSNIASAETVTSTTTQKNTREMRNVLALTTNTEGANLFHSQLPSWIRACSLPTTSSTG
jgi:hypothetical protein